MRKPKVLAVGLKVSGKQRDTLDLLHRTEAIIIVMHMTVTVFASQKIIISDEFTSYLSQIIPHC